MNLIIRKNRVSTVQVLNSATLFICLVCVFFALKNVRQNCKVNVSYAAMMGCIGLLIMELLFITLGWRHITTQWFWFSGWATVCVPAWFYLYFSSSLRLESRFQIRDVIHFVPSFIFLLLSLPYATLSFEQKQEVAQLLIDGAQLNGLLQLVPMREERMGLVAILTAFYLPLCWHELHSEMSHKKRDVLRQIRPLRWGIMIFAMIFAFAFMIFMIKLPLRHNWLISSAILPVVLGFAYLYWRLPQWGHNWKVDPNSGIADVTAKEESSDGLTGVEKEDKKYRSSVNDDLAESTLDKLDQLLLSGVYKDSTLTLRKLANELNLSQHHLSQIINENTEGNYYELINGYRIKEAKTLLSHTELSVIDVAYESGFNSKSAFYSEFKKQTGMTPGKFRDDH